MIDPEPRAHDSNLPKVTNLLWKGQRRFEIEGSLSLRYNCGPRHMQHKSEDIDSNMSKT